MAEMTVMVTNEATGTEVVVTMDTLRSACWIDELSEVESSRTAEERSEPRFGA